MKKLLFGICFLLLGFHGKSQFCHPVDSLQYAGNRPPGCQLYGPIYQGSMEGFTAEVVTDEMFPCGDVENNQFLSFVAGDTIISANFIASNCQNGDEAQIMIFDSNFKPISNCFSSPRSFPGNIVARLIPGEIYFFMIDGIDGEICDILLTVSYGISHSIEGYKEEPIKIIREHNFNPYCPNSETCFSIKKVENATSYQWTIPNSVQLLSGGTNQDTFACVQFSETPFQVIGVVPIFDTVYGAAASFLIEVNERISQIDTLICPGGQVTSGDSVFFKRGEFQVDFQNINSLGCDSTVLLNIKMPDTSAVEVEYFYDEFLKALTFSWEDRPLADYYELTLNGEKLPNQNHVGFLIQDALSGEEIELEVHPVGIHGCEYGTGKLSFIVPDFVNSKEQFSNADLKILPNPSNGIFEIFSNEKVLETTVFNSSGQKIKEKFNLKIDLSDFETGVYFFKILTEERVILRKVLKI